MRILAIDEGGYALDWLLRCRDAGHTIKWFIPPDKGQPSPIGKGFHGLEKVPDFERVIQSGWPDLIFQTDNVRYCQVLDRYRDNFCIIGPSTEAQRWEHEREFGMQVLEQAGIKVPPYKTFTNYPEAERYVWAEAKKNPGQRFVAKPMGNADKSLSYCAKSPADLVVMLRRWQQTRPKDGLPFLLQEFKSGTEMAVGGWFGPDGFSRYCFENFEFKKLMNGDVGVACGEQGTIGRYVRQSKLAKQMLQPLFKPLRVIRYVGYVDVNCIIDDDGQVWPLEFTMRPGWPTFNLQTAVHQGDPVEWLESLHDGHDSLQVDQKVVCGVVVSIPDYPYSKLTSKVTSGYPIWGVETKQDKHHFHPCYVQQSTAPGMIGDKLVDNLPSLVTAGDYVFIATGTGDTVKLASRAAYRLIKKIHVPNSLGYRTDIGVRLKTQLDALHKNGFALDFTYG